LRKVFAETKLPGTMQVSRPRAAHLVSPGNWLICKTEALTIVRFEIGRGQSANSKRIRHCGLQ
jgi:hypothetical protein